MLVHLEYLCALRHEFYIEKLCITSLPHALRRIVHLARYYFIWSRYNTNTSKVQDLKNYEYICCTWSCDVNTVSTSDLPVGFTNNINEWDTNKFCRL